MKNGKNTITQPIKPTVNKPTPQRCKIKCCNLLLLKCCNVVAFVVTLTFNYISSAGLISPYGVGTISRLHPTRITPASGAFAIWAYIYVLQGFFLAYQFIWPKNDEATLLHGVGFWYVSACVCNSLWICIFVQGTTASMWLSTVVIVGLLSSLCKIYLNTNCWRTNLDRGFLQRIVLDVHLSLYAGWVTVATIVNTTVALTTVWTTNAETESVCSVVMLVVALLLNLMIVVTRQDCVWGFVLTWASYYISAMYKDDVNVFTTATVVCVVSAIVSGSCCVYVGVLFFRGRRSICDTTPVEQEQANTCKNGMDEEAQVISTDLINTCVQHVAKTTDDGDGAEV